MLLSTLLSDDKFIFQFSSMKPKIEDNNTAPIIFMFPFYVRLKSSHIVRSISVFDYAMFRNSTKKISILGT